MKPGKKLNHSHSTIDSLRSFWVDLQSIFTPVRRALLAHQLRRGVGLGGRSDQSRLANSRHDLLFETKRKALRAV